MHFGACFAEFVEHSPWSLWVSFGLSLVASLLVTAVLAVVLIRYDKK